MLAVLVQGSQAHRASGASPSSLLPLAPRSPARIWPPGSAASAISKLQSQLPATLQAAGVSFPAAEAAGTAQLPGLLAQRRSTLHPSTMQMVIEALQAKDSKKGASATAIKKFILAKYPTVDPIRLKYWLKVALNKGLSRGDLVRPPNSTATGAAGSFKLAPKMLKQKQLPGQADPDRGQPLKPAQHGTTKPSEVPAAGARQPGAVEEKLTAAKQKPRVKPVKAPPPAAAKPRSNGAKPPQAVGHPQAPGKGCSGPSMALAAESAGGDSDDNPAGARAKQPRKTPVGKSKGKAPKGAQPEAPKVKGGEGKVRKPRVQPGAGEGEASLRKAVPPPAGRKAP
ncbi:histone H1oo [Strigops habroptila]|uniref:histone H1oo n=1 Tax=Strigops habroptila TaxID=2489341 RepID=UPI0011CFED70|nr:histone H1oo [Strigops habroptila]